MNGKIGLLGTTGTVFCAEVEMEIEGMEGVRFMVWGYGWVLSLWTSYYGDLVRWSQEFKLGKWGWETVIRVIFIDAL